MTYNLVITFSSELHKFCDTNSYDTNELHPIHNRHISIIGVRLWESIVDQTLKAR